MRIWCQARLSEVIKALARPNGKSTAASFPQRSYDEELEGKWWRERQVVKETEGIMRRS